MENILRDCAEKLLSAANSIVSAPSANSTQSSTPAPVVPAEPSSSSTFTPVITTTTNVPPTPTTTSYTALLEHRRLFGYRPPASTSRIGRQSHVMRSSARNMTAPYTKKSLAKNTFTRAFVCLSEVNKFCPPNAAERIRLSLSGLGEQTITFLKDGDAAHVHEKFLETFPNLVKGGGYEIMRTSDGNSKRLIDVPCPRGGYDVKFLKSALGQAKGYLRPLQKDIHLDNVTEMAQDLDCSPKVACVNCNEEIVMSAMRDHQQTCGGGPSGCQPTVSDRHSIQASIVDYMQSDHIVDQEAITILKNMFPETDTGLLSTACIEAVGDVNKAVDIVLARVMGTSQEEEQSNHAITNTAVSHTIELFDSDDSSDDEELNHSIAFPLPSQNTGSTDILSILKSLGKNLRGPYLRITTDANTMLSDALATYKNPKFNGSRPLRVSFANQPAIDTGGVSREFFDKVYEKLANGDDEAFGLFEGPPTKLLPAYSSRIVFSGIMEAIGKMIAHSISQCGIGFSKLSPACYWYIVYGDISKAIPYAQLADVHDQEVAGCLQKVINATSIMDVDDLNRDETFINILSDIGSTSILSLQNKDEIALCHFALNKRKVSLDQLKDGLKINGVLEAIMQHPEIMAPLFLWKEECINAEFVKSKLRFPEGCGDHVVKHLLLHFIDECREQELENFLSFTTGTVSVAGLRSITVKFDKSDGEIFASTCLKMLHLPNDVQFYDDFKEALKAVIMDHGTSFNTP
ncbi:uncharacterized protein LOC114543462 [Dendronephthya gigantea]|uniref:uncharacterized protein LOC114543462 n=1 Tax=Dendronephthya gigantea TaxID=151771 RepID=UPI00106C8E2A|nr:uncharacterized protein LOC114543462 [Dendronephthya gigantea]